MINILKKKKTIDGNVVIIAPAHAHFISPKNSIPSVNKNVKSAVERLIKLYEWRRFSYFSLKRWSDVCSEKLLKKYIPAVSFFEFFLSFVNKERHNLIFIFHQACLISEQFQHCMFCTDCFSFWLVYGNRIIIFFIISNIEGDVYLLQKRSESFFIYSRARFCDTLMLLIYFIINAFVLYRKKSG